MIFCGQFAIRKGRVERSREGTKFRWHHKPTRQQHKAREAALKADWAAAAIKLVSATMSHSRGAKRAAECDLSEELWHSAKLHFVH